MIVKSNSPPRFGQCGMSMSITRSSNRAPLMRCCRARTLSTSPLAAAASEANWRLSGPRLRHHHRAQRGVERQCAVEPDQV